MWFVRIADFREILGIWIFQIVGVLLREDHGSLYKFVSFRFSELVVKIHLFFEFSALEILLAALLIRVDVAAHLQFFVD